MDYFHF